MIVSLLKSVTTETLGIFSSSMNTKKHALAVEIRGIDVLQIKGLR